MITHFAMFVAFQIDRERRRNNIWIIIRKEILLNVVKKSMNKKWLFYFGKLQLDKKNMIMCYKSPIEVEINHTQSTKNKNRKEKQISF